MFLPYNTCFNRDAFFKLHILLFIIFMRVREVCSHYISKQTFKPKQERIHYHKDIVKIAKISIYPLFLVFDSPFFVLL